MGSNLVGAHSRRRVFVGRGLQQSQSQQQRSILNGANRALEDNDNNEGYQNSEGLDDDVGLDVVENEDHMDDDDDDDGGATTVEWTQSVPIRKAIPPNSQQDLRSHERNPQLRRVEADRVRSQTFFFLSSLLVSIEVNLICRSVYMFFVLLG